MARSSMSGRGTRALVVVKDGTGTNTARTPDTETKVEGMKIDNEFSDLSNDYTIQELEFEKGDNYPSVKGRLKKSLIFWRETLSANSAILQIIDNGCKISFFKTPKCALFRNNQSALKNKDFVEESISESLKYCRRRETSRGNKPAIGFHKFLRQNASYLIFKICK